MQVQVNKTLVFVTKSTLQVLGGHWVQGLPEWAAAQMLKCATDKESLTGQSVTGSKAVGPHSRPVLGLGWTSRAYGVGACAQTSQDNKLLSQTKHFGVLSWRNWPKNSVLKVKDLNSISEKNQNECKSVHGGWTVTMWNKDRVFLWARFVTMCYCVAEISLSC